MITEVSLKNIKGNIEAIISKSMAHRKIIAAIMSNTDIEDIETSRDIIATKKCMKALTSGEDKFYCEESGSTLRFLLPMAGVLDRKGTFITEGRLSERPVCELTDELMNHGMDINKNADGNIEVSGKLKSGIYKIRGDISSQYISGLLFALPLLEGDSEIQIIGREESKPYINMTLSVLSESNIVINNFHIPGGQRYNLKDKTIERDWSNAAFWFSAGALLEEGIEVTGLDTESLQGDKEIIEILKNFGAEVKITDKGIQVKKKALNGININAADIPDLVPVISLVAAAAKGKTRIYNVRRLRLKESDRLKSTVELLKKLGAEIEVINEELIINGKNGNLVGTDEILSVYNDHRIAMTAAVASIVCDRSVKINGSEAVGKSYPGFFEDVIKMGGNVKNLKEIKNGSNIRK